MATARKSSCCWQEVQLNPIKHNFICKGCGKLCDCVPVRDEFQQAIAQTFDLPRGFTDDISGIIYDAIESVVKKEKK